MHPLKHSSDTPFNSYVPMNRPRAQEQLTPDKYGHGACVEVYMPVKNLVLLQLESTGSRPHAQMHPSCDHDTVNSWSNAAEPGICCCSQVDAA
jgi:hypothetical protein